MRLLLTSLVCFLAVNFALSQNYYLEGPEVTCEKACETYYLNSDNGSGTTNLQFEYFMEVEPFPGASQINLVNNIPAAFRICFNAPGTYLFVVLVYGPNSSVTTVNKTIFVQPHFFNSIIPSTESCFNQAAMVQKVCSNSTHTYTYTGNTAGQSILWNVTGAVSYQSNFNQLTVTWGDAGFGAITVFDSLQFCSLPNNSFLGVQILEKIVANFSFPSSSYCLGEPVPFANNSQGASQFTWNFGDGSSSNEISPNHTYTKAGTYTITLKAYNECGCFEEYESQVTIKDLWIPKLSCVSTICEYSEVTYETDAVCGTFTWTVSNNGVVKAGGGSSDNFITIAWGKGPQGLLSLKVDGCNTPMCPGISENIIPIISSEGVIIGNKKPCAYTTEFYSVNKYDATQYQWTVTGGEILSGQGQHEIAVKWNGAPNSTVHVNFDNCYLKCGGSKELAVTVGIPFKVNTLSSSLCKGEEIHASAVNTALGSPVSVTWTLKNNSGTIMTSANGNTFNYNTSSLDAGKYFLIASDVNSCNEEVRTIITIKENSPKATSIIGEEHICKGNTYAYEAQTNLTNGDFEWTIKDGATTTTKKGRSILISWTSDGPYELQVSQRDLNGAFCFSEPILRTIHKLILPPLVFDAEACSEDSIVIKAKYYENIKYNWTTSPVSAATTIDKLTNELKLQVVSAGNLTVDVEVCGEQKSATIHVHALPVAVVIHDAQACESLPTLVKTSVGYTSYTWFDENGTPISNLNEPSLVPGTYTIQVADALGCKDKESFTIRSIPKPEINISSPQYTTFCPASQPFPSLHAIDSENGYSFKWLKNGVDITFSGTIFNSTEEGVYQVEATNIYGCKNLSNPINVKVDCTGGGGGGGCVPIGSTTFKSTLTPDCNHLDFTNTTTDFLAGSSSWYFDDAASGINNISNALNPTHEFSKPGFYKVTLLTQIEESGNPGNYCNVIENNIVEIPMKADFDLINACAAATVQFYDNSTFLPGNTITQWAWDFGDAASGLDNTSSLQNPSHTFATDGTYLVKLTIGNGSCVETVEKSITVHPKPTATFASSVSQCENIATRFDLTSTFQVSEISWEFGEPASGDLNTLVASIDGYHAYDNAGMYTVTTQVKSIFGCENIATQNIEIFTNSLTGAITSSAGTTLCRGQSTTLLAPAALNYVWSDTTHTNTSTLIVNEPNVYSVTVSDQYGCIYVPQTITIHVNDNPKSSVTISSFEEDKTTTFYNSAEFCAGLDASIAAEPNLQYSFSWSTFQIGNEITFTEALGNQLNSGDHYYKVTIMDTQTNCKTVIDSIHIKVNALPVPITIAANNTGILCSGSEHILTVSNIISGIDYTWSNGELGQSITESAAGLYSVLGTNEFGCSIESNALTITQGPDISLIPSGCFKRCTPDTLCFPNVPNVNAYQWFYNGISMGSTNGADSPNLIITDPLASGTYQVSMTDVFGCVASSNDLNLELIDGTGSIFGNVYYDENLNGLIDPTDPGYDTIHVIVDELYTTITNADGAFVVPNLASGWHQIRIELADSDTLLIGPDSVYVDGCNLLHQPEDTIEFLLGAPCKPEFKKEFYIICPGSFITIEGQPISETKTITTTKLVNNCPVITEYNVEVLPRVNYTTQSTASCEGSSNGTISIEPDATGVFTFSIESKTISNNFTFQNIAPGNYSILATDQFGCQQNIDNVSVAQIDKIHFDVTNTIIPCDAQEAHPTVIFSQGNTGSVDINWSNGSTGESTSVINTEDLFVTLTSVCEVIEEKVEIKAITHAPYTYDVVNVCPGQINGLLTITPGESGDFTYTLSTGHSQTGNGKFELPEGTYSVEIKSDKYCTDTLEAIQVSRIDPLIFEVVNTYIDCESTSTDPTITLEGSNHGQLDVVWSNGDHGLSTNVDEPGFVLAVLKNECETREVNVEIKAKERAIFSVQPKAACNDEDNGSILITSDKEGIFQYTLKGIAEAQNTNQFTNLNDGFYEVEISSDKYCTETITDIPVKRFQHLEYEVTQFTGDCSTTEFSPRLTLHNIDEADVQILWSNGDTGLETTWNLKDELTLTIKNDCQQITEFFSPDIIESNDIYPHTNVFEGQVYDTQELVESIFSKYNGPRLRGITISDRMGRLVLYVPNTGNDIPLEKIANASIESGLYMYSLDLIAITCNKDSEIRRTGKFIVIRN